MNCKKTIVICITIGLILGSSRIYAQTAEELLPKGIQLEVVKGELEKAIEIYRKIAQLDFAYKDVRQRIDKLRSEENKQGHCKGVRKAWGRFWPRKPTGND